MNKLLSELSIILEDAQTTHWSKWGDTKDGRKRLLMDDLLDLFDKALQDQRKDIYKKVEGMRKMLFVAKNVPIGDDLTTMRGVQNHAMKELDAQIEANAFKSGFNQALDEVLKLIGKAE